MYSTITTTSKQVLVWALMFTLVLSVFPTTVADEADDEWFYDIYENVTDEDGDGSDDTIDIGYDPDTTCDCDIDIFVYIDIYDEDGYVDYIYDEYTINNGEYDELSQDWTPDYSGTFDFYVEMYDEWDNYEDNWSVTGIELEPMTGSSDETINVDNQVGDYHDDGINNDFGMFAFIKNDAVEDVEVEVEYFNGVIWVYYANGTTDDSGEFIVENATTGEYRWTAEYDGEGLEEETVSYTEVDTVSNLSHAVGVDDWDGAGDYDDFFAYVFEGDDTKDDAYIEIYDEDGDLYDSGNTDYDYYGFDIYVIYDVEKGNYTFDFYYEEDGELLQSGWLYSYGSTSTNYDEWFEDWDYETEDTNDDGEANSIITSYDPDTECDCTVDIEVEMYVYNNDTGDYMDSDYYDHSINGTEDDSFETDDWSPSKNGNYTFDFYLYDEEGNMEDYFNFTLYLECDENSNDSDCDNDEWFEDWDYETEDTDDDNLADTIDISYNPDTDCDCEVNVEVDISVYENSTGDWVDSEYDYHTINGTEEEYFEQSWTSHESQSYDFYVYMYDDEWNWEDEFWVYNVYLYQKSGAGGPGDDDEYFDWIDDYVWDDDDDGYNDTVELDYDPDTTCECDINVTLYIDIYDNGTGAWVNGTQEDYTIYHDDDDYWYQEWSPEYNGTFDFYVELYDEDENLEEEVEYLGVDLHARSSGGGGDGDDDEWFYDWDYDVYPNSTITIGYDPDTDCDCDVTIHVYVDVYDNETGDYLDYTYAEHEIYNGYYDWFEQNWTAYENGSYDFQVSMYDEDYNEEDDFWIYNVSLTSDDGGGGGSEDDDEWFYDWGYDVNPSDTITIGYDPDTECDCDVTIHVYVDIYDNETGDYLDYTYAEHEINNGYGDWFTQNWTAYENGSYDFNAIMYDEDGNEEDDFWIYNVSLGSGGGGDEDYDEYFYNWDYYGTEEPEWNKLIIAYDPDTDCDCDVDVEVYIDVLDNETGDYVGSLYDDHTIYNGDSDWFEQEWTADYAGKYDFYVELYDQEYGHPEDSFEFSLIMSDEWFESSGFHQEGATVYIDLDPQTDYEGEILTHYYLYVYHLNENDEWEWIDNQVIYDVSITGSNDNEDIHLEWTAEEDGKYRFEVWMEDEYWNGEDWWDDFEVEINLNQAPVIEDLNVDHLFEGQLFNFEVDAFDADDDELEYTWDMGDGSLEKEGDSVRYGYQDDGVYTVTVWVSDGELTTDKEFQIVVENMAPALEVSFVDEADEGSELSFAAQVNDVASDDVTVTWTFADGSRVEGTFAQYTFRDNGEYLVVVVAEDEDGGTTMQQLLVIINNVAPAFTQFVMPSGAEEGEALDFMVSATDPGDDTITYTFDFGDDTAIMMTPDGNISHKFADGDTFTIVICAQDEDGGESCRTETLPVSILEQMEEEGLLPGFGVLGALSALGVIGILRRRTH